MRWAESLKDVRYTIEYTPKKNNQVVDATKHAPRLDSRCNVNGERRRAALPGDPAGTSALSNMPKTNCTVKITSNQNNVGKICVYGA